MASHGVLSGRLYHGTARPGDVAALTRARRPPCLLTRLLVSGFGVFWCAGKWRRDRLPCLAGTGFPISGGCRVREFCDGVLLMPCSPSRFSWVWNVAPGGLSTGACAVAIPAPASIAANAEPIRSVRLRLPLIILFDMAISFLS